MNDVARLHANGWSISRLSKHFEITKQRVGELIEEGRNQSLRPRQPRTSDIAAIQKNYYRSHSSRLRDAERIARGEIW